MPVLGLVAAVLVHAALGIDDNVAIWVALPLLALLLMVRIVQKARRRERDRLGPLLEVRVDRPGRDYRAAGEATAAAVIRGRATRRASTAVVEHVWIELRVVEETCLVTSSSEGGTHHVALRTTLWERDLRLDYDPDGVYPFELPLPEPGSMPFSTGRDERGRGVYWEVSARIVREDRADDEWARCGID